MALAMVFRLAFRITRGLLPAGEGTSVALVAAPALAGLLAAASLLNSGGFIVQNALGYAEGLGTALTLIAVDRLMDGAPRQALVLGFFAALDRPELWLVWVPFGLWLAWRDPGARRLVLGLFALTPALWLLPELWGSGQLFRGVVRAHHPNPGTPAFTHCPACTVLDQEAWPTIMRRVTLPAIAALLLAAGLLWRTRRGRGGRRASTLAPRQASWGWLLVLGGAGFLWWLGIAAETQAGFAGNSRYLELGTALVAIAGGVAWGWIAIAAGSVLRRLARPAWAAAGGTLLAVALLVAAPPWIGRNVIDLPRVAHELDYQAKLRSDLARAIPRSGGARALLSCGAVMAEGYQVPMAAWMLGVPATRIEPAPARPATSDGLRSRPPGVILQDRAHPGSALLPAAGQIRAWEHGGARYTLMARVRTFNVFSTCAHKVSR
jgi:hypothetical protein